MTWARSRCTLGPEVPEETLLWQDPLPEREGELIDDADIAILKTKLLESGLSVSQLVTTAWASASTFRASDKRGSANGARIRLARSAAGRSTTRPAGAGAAHPGERPAGVQRLLRREEGLLADLIVLGGAAGVEKAAKEAGFEIQVPFTPGRVDATEEHTDVESFEALEPTADGFRNYLGRATGCRPSTCCSTGRTC